MASSLDPKDEQRLTLAAEALVQCLAEQQCKIVFAESCTGGLVAATLARIPGVSEFLCGSAVVYRNATKTQWLDVSAHDLDDESIGPVSPQVAAAMSRNVLEMTAEASVSLSVTGHIGPAAPDDLDGVIYIGKARRLEFSGGIDLLMTEKVKLSSFAPSHMSLRVARQTEAAAVVLEKGCEWLRLCAIE